MSDSIWKFISTSASSSRAVSVRAPCCWNKTLRASGDQRTNKDTKIGRRLRYWRLQVGSCRIAPFEKSEMKQLPILESTIRFPFRTEKEAQPVRTAPLGIPATRLSPLTPCENETTLNAGSR